ncbi:LacI family DNA-binding transcriptional regulator [Ruficoccus sp. ZRK36]|uniref:LacI family DNA-binding transcriptional regulator n=1 Tax=Ruficoccus sp. ZRK36 TaxID=2866311 RepID=UPI001C7319FC|nr:LacI family DNA-binding transcriptional regulator [Ruficoccus sp. ZRK36]QYY34340.1 LacI family transcriptional regulator [Ruficoccus sp. ZRK36]
MSKQKRITQQDIARRAGVHRSTVSQALKNHPVIPRKTCERIQRLAEEMGYRPDPMLSALASYRNRNHAHTFMGTMAWLYITDREPLDSWRYSRTNVLYYEGALKRADQHGYKLELFEFNSQEISIQRMASILKARNIAGVLLCPLRGANIEMDFCWDDFSFITFGYSLKKPELHTVTSTQYRSMVQTMNKMHERGYRRIAYVFNNEHSKRTDNNYLSAYLSAQFQIGEPPLVFDYEWRDAKDLAQRLESVDLEAIVTGDPYLMERMQKVGVRVPEDTAMACPLLLSNTSDQTGVYENSEHIGVVAVDCLTKLIMHGDRGIPKLVQRTHIEGEWIEGKSLPDRRKQKKTPRRT